MIKFWEQWTLAWDDGKQWGHLTTNLAELVKSVLKKWEIFQSMPWSKPRMRIWTNISSTVGLKLMQWLPPDKFTHWFWPSSSMKKKLSLTLTSFSNLTAKDLSFKLKKGWIRERGVTCKNSLWGRIKEHVIMRSLKSYTWHVHVWLLHVSTSI